MFRAGRISKAGGQAASRIGANGSMESRLAKVCLGPEGGRKLGRSLPPPQGFPAGELPCMPIPVHHSRSKDSDESATASLQLVMSRENAEINHDS